MADVRAKDSDRAPVLFRCTRLVLYPKKKRRTERACARRAAVTFQVLQRVHAVGEVVTHTLSLEARSA